MSSIKPPSTLLTPPDGVLAKDTEAFDDTQTLKQAAGSRHTQLI